MPRFMTESKKVKIGGILLAAGGSSRMGQPKQLIRIDGISMLRRSAQTLVNSQCSPVVVVLGAEIDGSTAVLTDLPTHIAVNDSWQAGMSSSIKTGLYELLRLAPDLDAVLVTLCDQPLVKTEDINLFCIEFCKNKPDIITARCGEVVGVPALFSRSKFSDLMTLVGDKGARDMIRNHPNLATVLLDQAAFDIDSPLDLERISEKNFD